MCAQRRLGSAWASAQLESARGIRPVWSESLLSAWRKLGSLATHWAHSEDSDQTGQMPRLISLHWVHSHFVGFVVRRLKYFSHENGSVLTWSTTAWELLLSPAIPVAVSMVVTAIKERWKKCFKIMSRCKENHFLFKTITIIIRNNF